MICLAIETSARNGSIALGNDHALLAEATLPPPQRHRVELMPSIDALCREQQLSPADLDRVCVSVGPGSFTGLRIAVATAKMLAMSLDVQIVPVPTAHVVARDVDPAIAACLAVCLAGKQHTCHVTLFDACDGVWRPSGEPDVMAIDDLLAQAPHPLAVAGSVPGEPAQPDVLIVEARAHARHVWHLGRELDPIDPLQLVPVYPRPPEAQEQWEQRYGKAATIQSRNTQ